MKSIALSYFFPGYTEKLLNIFLNVHVRCKRHNYTISIKTFRVKLLIALIKNHGNRAIRELLNIQ